MNLTSFVICEQIINFNGDSNAPALLKPIGVFVLPFLPSLFSFVVSVGIGDIKPNDNGEIRVMMLSPDSNKVFDVNFPLQNAVGVQDSIVINMQINNTVISSEGIHTFKVLFNEEEQAEYQIRVKVQGVTQ